MLQDLMPYFHGVIGNVCIVVMNIFFKMLSFVMPSIQILNIRSFLLFALNSYLIFSNQKYQFETSIQDKQSKFQAPLEQMSETSETQTTPKFQLQIKDRHVFVVMLKRLVLNCLSVWFLTVSLEFLPLGIVDAFFNTAPIMMFFIEAYFYKKPVLKIHLLFAFTCFLGVIMIVNPFEYYGEYGEELQPDSQKQTKSMNLLYISLPLLGAAMSCMSYMYLYELRGKVDQAIAIHYGYIFQTMYFGVLINFVDINLKKDSSGSETYFQASIFNPYFIGAFVMITLLTHFSYFFKIKAMFALPPSKIITLNYSGTILSVIFDVTIFGHETSLIQILGIFLTSIGLLSKLFFAWQQSKQKQQQLPRV